MQSLCKKYPLLMRPLLFIFLITGIWGLMCVVMIIIENIDDFLDAHVEVFNYIFKWNNRE